MDINKNITPVIMKLPEEAIVEEVPVPVKKKKKKSKKPRCAHCKKKVGSFGIRCKCGNLYCAKHRYASEHSCTWNYQDEARNKIRENNLDATFVKVDTI